MNNSISGWNRTKGSTRQLATWLGCCTVFLRWRKPILDPGYSLDYNIGTCVTSPHILCVEHSKQALPGEAQLLQSSHYLEARPDSQPQSSNRFAMNPKHPSQINAESLPNLQHKASFRPGDVNYPVPSNRGPASATELAQNVASAAFLTNL